MNLIHEYTQFSSLTKSAVGGSLGAIAIYAAAATNPVTLVGLAALGQAAAWLPDGIRKCFQCPAAAAPVHEHERGYAILSAFSFGSLCLGIQLQLSLR